MYREEGLKSFFRGFGAASLRAFPTNAVTFYIVAMVKRMLEN
jgi:solute carrier family 25 carnitine/acylcarnitine transporter 20/29